MKLGHAASEARLKADALKRLQVLYFNEFNKREKDAIRSQIEAIEWELIEVTLVEYGNKVSLQEIQRLRQQRVKPFFLWKLYFAEVFEEKGGFDVIIANPPYGAKFTDQVDS